MMVRCAARLCALALVLLITLLGCGGDDLYVREHQPSDAYAELRAAIDTCLMTGSAVLLARDFMGKYPDDVAVQILASSLRYDMTGAEQAAHYRERAEREPDNSVAQYLAGRITYIPDEGQRYANAILSDEPNNYWGHLLLGRSLSWKQDLSDQEFSQAEAELRQAIALNNSLPYAVESLGYLYAQRGDTARADHVYEKLCDMEPTEFERVRLRLDLAQADDEHDLHLIDNFIERNHDNLAAHAYKADLLYQKHDWTDYRKAIRQVFAVKQDSVLAYNMACSFAVENQSDSAFAWLQNAMQWGYSDVYIAGDDPDLESIRSDPRWDAVLREMAEKRSLQILETSKREVAEAKWQRAHWSELGLTETAPDFTLPDLENKMVRLSDLRGKFVILDFWATWCYWCHRASPLIDEFSSQAPIDRIAVFGVNVMERDVHPEALQAFLMQRGVNFPTLIGNEQVTDAYKVIGLPSIFVIDPQGKLAYRAYGYSPALGETLKAIMAEHIPS